MSTHTEHGCKNFIKLASLVDRRNTHSTRVERPYTVTKYRLVNVTNAVEEVLMMGVLTW